MAIIQKYEAIRNQPTFAELVDTLFRKLKTEASACGRTDVILVVHVDESIKDAE